MFTSTATFNLTDALVGAGAYSPHGFAHSARVVPLHVLADIRHAQVEIYCGHNAQAVKDIRAASKGLRSSTSFAALPPQALATLDQAAWLTRRGQYHEAERRLDGALSLIGSLQDKE